MNFKLIRSTAGISTPCPEGAVLAIGNFDGVHQGHLHMVKRAVDYAKTHDLVSMVLTFSPHPQELFKPERRHHRIMRVGDKVRKLKHAQLDCLYVQKFTRDFAAMPAEDFVRDFLVNHLNVKRLVVGVDFHFGKGRAGNVEMLQTMGAELGFSVDVIEDITEDDLRVSSTRIRGCLEKGEVAHANILLGSPWCVRTGLYEDENLVLRGKINRYLPIKNGVYWVKIMYTYLSEFKEATLPLAVKDGEVKIHPIGQIPDIPEGRVLIEFLKLEKPLNV